MQSQVPVPVGDVGPDPEAVFDAHGANTIDELLDSGPAPQARRLSGDDDAVAAFFDDGLTTPEPGVQPSRSADAVSEAPSERVEPADGEAILEALETAAAESSDAASSE